MVPPVIVKSVSGCEQTFGVHSQDAPLSPRAPQLFCEVSVAQKASAGLNIGSLLLNLVWQYVAHGLGFQLQPLGFQPHFEPSCVWASQVVFDLKPTQYFSAGL
jgi:hypothetical protein